MNITSSPYPNLRLSIVTGHCHTRQPTGTTFSLPPKLTNNLTWGSRMKIVDVRSDANRLAVMVYICHVEESVLGTSPDCFPLRLVFQRKSKESPKKAHSHGIVLKGSSSSAT